MPEIRLGLTLVLAGILIFLDWRTNLRGGNDEEL
jgi:hypothetical protein